MFESFITAFIIYFVVIDPVGNAPIFLADLSEHYVIDRRAAISIVNLRLEPKHCNLHGIAYDISPVADIMLDPAWRK